MIKQKACFYGFQNLSEKMRKRKKKKNEGWRQKGEGTWKYKIKKFYKKNIYIGIELKMRVLLGVKMHRGTQSYLESKSTKPNSVCVYVCACVYVYMYTHNNNNN